MFLAPQYLEMQDKVKHSMDWTIFLLIHFLPDHQFVSFATAALVFVWQIQVAGQSHLLAAGPHFVSNIALNVGWVAKNV